jgi:predicted PurR-regulated permease PerM
MPKTIEISHRTILFILGVLGAIWLVLQIQDILFLLFISFILMTALRPLVDMLVRVRLPRVLAILLIYVFLIGGFGSVVGTMVPTIASQTTRLIQTMPLTLEKIIPSFDANFQAITQEVGPVTQNIVRVGLEIFNNIVTVVTILVFTFYFLWGSPNVHGTFEKFFGEEIAERITTILADVEVRLGAWARGQIILMATIGISVYIGLSLLRLDFALPLALLAGLLEVVPMIGPT